MGKSEKTKDALAFLLTSGNGHEGKSRTKCQLSGEDGYESWCASCSVSSPERVS